MSAASRRALPVLLLAIVALVALAGPAAACRIVQDTYGTPAIGQGNLLSACLNDDPPLDSCVVFEPQGGETQVAVTITDQSGLSTHGTIGQDFNDDGLQDNEMTFCNSSGWFPVVNPVPIGRAAVTVLPHVSPGADASGGVCSGVVAVATSGTVTAVFC